MKLIRILPIVALFILGFKPIIGRAQVQTYSYSGSLDASTQVLLTPAPNYYDSGQTEADFGSICETVSYDPIANTVEEKGVINLSSSSPESFTILNASGPFGPTVVGAATVNVGNNGSFSFDNIISGVQPGRVSGFDFLIPVSGYGNYEGQTFSGSWDIQIPLYLDITSVSPTSLTFNQTARVDGSGSAEEPASLVVPLDPPYEGLVDGSADDNFFYFWDQTSTMGKVPDIGGSFALLGLGVAALALFRKNEGRRLSQVSG